MTDPIADMLTRVRNALAIKKPEIVLPYSKVKFNIAKVLEKEKLIEKVEIIDAAKSKTGFKQLKIKLKYNEDNQPVIGTLKRISSPGQRIYVKKDKIPKVLNGLGMNILSTSKGLMTGQEAREKGLGGELICEIW
ncbi:30S ribosomal protein S8 [Patescibacteria group bacterium]|nr:30S ribosomal protein S8 [Patescibacteria group bacterium]